MVEVGLQFINKYLAAMALVINKIGTHMKLVKEEFLPHLNTSFQVFTQLGTVNLILREVNPLPRGVRPAALRDPLAIVFEGPDDIALLQDNFELHHPELGINVWCLVPIGGPIPGIDPDAKYLYQATFN